MTLGGDSYIVPALTEDPMEILARADDPARGLAIAMNAMSTVADAPNSEAAATGAFAFEAWPLLVSGDVADTGLSHFESPFELNVMG